MTRSPCCWTHVHTLFLLPWQLYSFTYWAQTWLAGEEAYWCLQNGLSYRDYSLKTNICILCALWRVLSTYPFPNFPGMFLLHTLSFSQSISHYIWVSEGLIISSSMENKQLVLLDILPTEKILLHQSHLSAICSALAVHFYMLPINHSEPFLPMNPQRQLSGNRHCGRNINHWLLGNMVRHFVPSTLAWTKFIYKHPFDDAVLMAY